MFEDSIKTEAKRRGNFRCAACQKQFVEVQHIVPPAEDGSDEIDNAIPLCAFCHHRHGDNPGLRDKLRGLRDAWWARCEQGREGSGVIELNQELDQLRADYMSDTALAPERVAEVKDLLLETIEGIRADVSSVDTVPEILAASTAVSGSMNFFPCPACGYSVPYGAEACANCGGRDWPEF